MEVVLPIVTQAYCDRELGLDTDLVLNEASQFLIRENVMGLTPLQGIQERVVVGVIRQARKCEFAREIRVVVETDASPIGNIDAHLQKMSPAIPGKHIIDFDRVFCE